MAWAVVVVEVPLDSTNFPALLVDQEQYFLSTRLRVKQQRRQ
jgi:hypothetical protein